MTTETRKRREYTEDFKRDAVALVTEQGYKVSEAARSLGIGDGLIRRWKREYDEAASGVQLGMDILARPERFELPTAWFVVFRLKKCILLLFHIYIRLTLSNKTGLFGLICHY